MTTLPKNQSLQDLHRAVGEAISEWTAVEIQVYQIFGITLSLTARQPGGGWSGTSTGPSAVLNAIESFQTKLKLVTAALKDALSHDGGQFSSESAVIIDVWLKLEKRVNRLSQNRNKLAYWTTASSVGKRGKARVGLIPPPYSSKYQDFVADRLQAVTETDVSDWKSSFRALAIELIDFAGRLAGYRELQYKHVGQMLEQCLVSLPQDRTLIEFVQSKLRVSR